MRVSTAYQYDSYVRDVGNAQERYFDAQKQVSSGKRFTAAEEDWMGTAHSLSMRSIQAAVSQYRKNVQDVKAAIGFAGGSFGEAGQMMKQAYSLAVQAANTSTSQAGRQAMVDQVTQMQSRLVAIGNTRGAMGEYIFGGHKNDSAPFTVDSSGIVFTGDNQSVMVEVAPSQTMAKNYPGETLFVDAYNALETFKTHLLGGDVGAISGVDIAALQNQNKTFVNMQGQTGSSIQALDAIDVDHQNRLEQLASGISDIEDVDMAEAVVNLQLSQTAYQAALSAASRGFNMSLLDFING